MILGKIHDELFRMDGQVDFKGEFCPTKLFFIFCCIANKVACVDRAFSL